MWRSKRQDVTGQDLSSCATCVGVALCLGSQQGCLPEAWLSLCNTMPPACVLALAWSLLTLLFLPLAASSQLGGAVPALQVASNAREEPVR